MVTDGFVGTNEEYTRGYLWAGVSQRRYEAVIVKGQSQRMLNSLLFFGFETAVWIFIFLQVF